ncbi:TonB-dependent receptor [Chitinophaga sancti]|uniref:TonB-dependent receptor n=2 Tax=Chitinophaga sancti TaxID=1004 RepID=A0ABZ0XGU9_9BACT|nr:TonB-dependent receptor [Chitinophaga sancti]WQD64520.1 TonB-dependent receptor [Chitinophaga sancti]WQG89855.1 TonB-dependent receptor [Chitinophaga sancti]
MMKTLLTTIITLLLIVVTISVRSQDATGKVTGYVKDVTGQPVIAATVVLRKAADSTLVKAALSDTAGLYSFEQLPFGNYLVAITSISFQPQWLSLNLNSAAQELPATILTLSSKSLSAVTVTSKRPIIEQFADRTVVNVETMVSASGGSAMDVLEKSPGVTVDKQGNLSIRGKQGVKVFIDGRDTYVNGADLSAILRNMQASQVDQVEIISNPSAKYDAAGNGVINIRTKKSAARGFNGSIALAYLQGRYPGTTQQLTFNYRSKYINLFGNAGYAYRKGFEDVYILRNFRTTSDEIKTIYDQRSYTRNLNKSLNAKLGIDFYLSGNTMLSVAGSGFRNPSSTQTENRTLLKSPDGTVQTIVMAPADMDGKWNNGEANISLKHNFDSAGHAISLDGSYMKYTTTSVQHFNNSYYDGKNNPTETPSLFMADMPGNIRIYSFKGDYTLPLSRTVKVEAGAKYSDVSTDNNAQYYLQQSGRWVRSDSLSNHFLYKEKVLAGYLNFNGAGERFEWQVGLRAEHMDISGTQINGDKSFTRNALQWFPSALVAYTLDKQNKLSASYSRRIERPDYKSLNPFRFYLDQYTYEEGNPYLKPQYSNNFELSHIFMDGALTTTLLYNKTSDVIQEVVQQRTSSNETFIRPENISTRRVAGINTSAQIPLSDNLTTILYLEYNSNKYKGRINDEPFSLQANTFSGQLRQQIKLPGNWMVELAGQYTSRAIDGTFIQQPMGVMGVGLQKDLMKKMLTLRLTGVDLFRWTKYEATSRYQLVDIYALTKWQTQALRFVVTYRFRSGLKVEDRSQEKSASPEKDRVKMNESK